MDNDSKGPTIAKHLQSIDIQKIIFQLRVDSVKETVFLKDRCDERARLCLPMDFDSLLPREKMYLLTATGADSAAIGRFPLLAGRANCVRPVAGSLRCVSSGINSYASF